MIPLKSFWGLTTIDWPSKIASLIYFGGCNFRCPFCYNIDLVKNPQKLPNLKEEEVLEKLKERKNFIDGVVLTGGEPTIASGLFEFLRKIKKIGLPCAIETNGSKPDILKKLLEENLVKAIFMDIKGPLEKYQKIVKVKIDPNKIKESVELIKRAKIEAEFRTTVVPELLAISDIKKIGEWLGGSIAYALQQFQNKKTLDPAFQEIKPYEKEELEKMRRLALKYFKKVEIRGV